MLWIKNYRTLDQEIPYFGSKITVPWIKSQDRISLYHSGFLCGINLFKVLKDNNNKGVVVPWGLSGQERRCRRRCPRSTI